MLSKNSYDGFDERPEYKAKQCLFSLLLLIAKVIERLLHGLSQLLSEFSWIEGKKSSVENMNYSRVIGHTQKFLGKVSAPVPA